MDRQRIQSEQAFVLHRRPFRDTSQIVDLISANFGRIALVARGVRSQRSRYRGVLEPFTELSVSWSSRGDLGSLNSAEALGSGYRLVGDALLAGFYLNELLLRLTHRHDPQPALFAAYAHTLRSLAHHEPLEVVLRHFEFRLLELLGYGVQLRRDIVSGQLVTARQLYRLSPGDGPSPISGGQESEKAVSGAQLEAIDAGDFSDPKVLNAARRITRAAIDACLDGRELKSRQVMIAMRNHRRRAEIKNGQS